jgi:hypothetical protein
MKCLPYIATKIIRANEYYYIQYLGKTGKDISRNYFKNIPVFPGLGYP